MVTAEGSRIAGLGKTAAIDAACAALSLSDPKSDPEKGLKNLRDLVVAKLGLAEKTTRVLVSSDGALSYVPFSLLLEGKLVAYIPSGTTYGLNSNG